MNGAHFWHWLAGGVFKRGRMRILQISEDIPYPSMGGLAKHVLTLCKGLQQAGHQVDLLGGSQNPLSVSGQEAQFGGRFFGQLDGHLAGWKERQLGMLQPSRRTWTARRFARTILRHAEHYDVLHYHGHLPNVACFIPADVNFIQTRHDQGSDCVLHTRFKNGAICRSVASQDCAGCVCAAPNRLQRSVSAYAVSRFREEVATGMQQHKTIFVSRKLQQNLARTLGPGPWGEVLHHFVDRSLIDAAHAAVVPVPQDQQINLITVGKLSPAKGIHALLHSLLAFLPAKMHLQVVGDGPLEASLRREFARAERVHFAGWCSAAHTLQMTAAAHAVIVPSLWEEPFGGTLLEGLLLGKPCFALHRGAIPELSAYAAAGQLRLHSALPALVKDLVAFDHFPDYGLAAGGLGGTQPVIDRLLAIYQLPPGPLPQSHITIPEISLRYR